MKLPFISPRPQPDSAGFYPTGITAAAVGENEMHLAPVAGKKVLITRSGGDLVAFSNVCPHAAADLSQGRLARGQIKCPDHGYTFDVRTGRATWPPGEGCHLIRYPLKVEQDEIMVRVP